MSLATKLLDLLGWQKTAKVPYWLKISTKVPSCIYYFGPFDNSLQAKASQSGYIEDLMAEKAVGIHVELEQRLQPEELTTCEEDFF